MNLEVKEKKLEDIIVCSVGGEININTSIDMRKEFEKLIREENSASAEGRSALGGKGSCGTASCGKKIVLNLSKVSYIDSSGLATLIEVLQRVKRCNGQMRLSNLSEKVCSLFEITKLDKLFNIFSSEEEALKNF